MTTLAPSLDVADVRDHFVDPVRARVLADCAVAVHTAQPPSLREPARSSSWYDPILRRADLLQNVDFESAEAIARDFEIFHADRGSVLFNQADAAEFVYVVLSGKVKLIHHAGDGRENITALLGPSDQFGELSLLDPGPRTATAVVVTDAWLARLSRAAFYAWITSRPQVAGQMLRVVSRRLRRTYANVSDLVSIDTPGRLAKELLRLAKHFGVKQQDEIRIMHDLSQAELAQLVGASRETVNKTLNNYVTRGWIRLENKCVVILDLERLAQRAR